jgi:hypothetical protein
MDDLVVGDGVEVFVLPDGRYMLSKAENNSPLQIEKITSAYIYFDGEISVEEI